MSRLIELKYPVREGIILTSLRVVIDCESCSGLQGSAARLDFTVTEDNTRDAQWQAAIVLRYDGWGVKCIGGSRDALCCPSCYGVESDIDDVNEALESLLVEPDLTDLN